jgi:hypothetical protein
VIADGIEIGVPLDVGYVVVTEIEKLAQACHCLGCVAGEGVTAGEIVQVVHVEVRVASDCWIGDHTFEKANRHPIVLGRPQSRSFPLLGLHRSPNLLFSGRLLRRQCGGTEQYGDKNAHGASLRTLDRKGAKKDS